MNKAELVAAVQQETSLPHQDSAAAVDAIIDIVVRSVHKGESVTIVGFGVFERRRRAPRLARNPGTGEPVKVRARNVPTFRPAAQFKQVIAGKQKLAKTGPTVRRGGLVTQSRAATPSVPATSRTKKGSSTGTATPSTRTATRVGRQAPPRETSTARAGAVKNTAASRTAQKTATKSTRNGDGAISASTTSSQSSGKKTPRTTASGSRAEAKRATTRSSSRAPRKRAAAAS